MIVYLLAFVCVLAVMIIVPVGVIFWILGLSLKAVGAMLMFSLKYLLPFVLVGIIIAKIRDKEHTFDWVDYAKHMGICAGIGVALILIFANLPANLQMPTEENIKSVTVSYETSDGIQTETMQTDWMVENICNSLSSIKYKHSIEEFIKESEYHTRDCTAEFLLDDGTKLTYTFLSPYDLCVKKGGVTHYYKVAKKSGLLPIDELCDIVFTVRERRASEIWKPAADEFFESITFTDEQKLYFEIPKEIPEGKFAITIRMSGMENYDRKTTFRAQRYEALQEIQKNQSWEKGAAYQFPVGNICYDEFDIIFNPDPGEEFVYDVLPILPNKNVFRRR